MREGGRECKDQCGPFQRQWYYGAIPPKLDCQILVAYSNSVIPPLGPHLISSIFFLLLSFICVYFFKEKCMYQVQWTYSNVELRYLIQMINKFSIKNKSFMRI
jgi:hypothetical protein